MSARRRRHELGFTMIELITGLGLMLTISAGAMLVVIASSRSGRNQNELSGIQRGGRTALSLLASEIESAGLGLPRALAVQGGNSNTLWVTSLDYQREWTVASTTGNTSSGTLTLDVTNPPYPSSRGDTDLAQNSWVFLYQNSLVDTSAAYDSGYGLLQLGAPRASGTVTVSVGWTFYSNNGQKGFNLGQALPSSPHKIVMLRAHTAQFGIDSATDSAHPFLFISDDGGSQDPVARNVDFFQLGYYLDANCDGQPDDTNADGVIDWNDTSSTPFATRVSPCDPAGTTEVQVTAIEIHLRLRSESIDQTLAPPGYHYATFSQLVTTRNISTLNGNYIFIDNKALCTSGSASDIDCKP